MHRGQRWLVTLFTINAVATLLHYVDNILRLEVYPDLPTTTRFDIVAFWSGMTPFGLYGLVLYRRGRTAAGCYLLYIYCVLNAAVLGHYARQPFSTIAHTIHFFILLEALTAVMLLAYVAVLHRRARRASGRSPQGMTGRVQSPARGG